MTYERLRLAREEKGWTIEEVSRRAGIRPRTIELIDRGEFAELPPGLYGRAAVRSYATVVGLDPAGMVDAVRPLLPSEGDPLGALARRCGHTLKADARSPEAATRVGTTVAASAVMSRASAAPAAPMRELAVRQVDTPGPVPVDLIAPEPALIGEPVTATVMSFEAVDQPELVAVARFAAEALDAPLHFDVAAPQEIDFDGLTLAGVEEPSAEDWEIVSRPIAAEPGREWWRPAAASAIDAVVLVGIGGGLVWLTALVGATTVPVVLRSAAPGIALVFALIVSLYFVLFGGVGNGTPGGSLMRLEARPSGRTILNARDVFGRAARAIYRDDSLVAD